MSVHTQEAMVPGKKIVKRENPHPGEYSEIQLVRYGNPALQEVQQEYCHNFRVSMVYVVTGQTELHNRTLS